MSDKTRLFPLNGGGEDGVHRRMRTEYCAGIIVAILLTLIAALVFGLVFGLGSTHKDGRIEQLVASNQHLQAEVMNLMMSSLAFSTRYVQNGTCKVGFPLDASQVPVSTAGFSDYVDVEYSLKEIILTQASVPLSVLVIGQTPRPITFPGYTPPPSLLRNTNLLLYIGLCEPGIAILDAASQNYDLLSYSYVTASKIVLEPNCVAMSLSEEDSAHCRPESGFNPFFSAAYSPNSANLYPLNNYGPGQAILEFVWGHWDYSSFGTLYDFVGTNVSFSGTLEMLLPNV